MDSLAHSPSARFRRLGARVGHDVAWLGIAGLFFVVEGAVKTTEVATRLLGMARPTGVPTLPVRSRRTV